MATGLWRTTTTTIILSIFGTRPEAIKMAPIVMELKRRPARVRNITCVTAQHRDMLDQVLAHFDIKPDYDLNVMRDGQTPSRVASTVLEKVDSIIRKIRPDWVLVQGDTTTVMAASIASFYNKVAIGHVEAGLRTHNRFQPFPEEINRRIAGVVADLHFAPTERARANLLAEGVEDTRILVTGNPVIDSLQSLAEAPYDVAGGPLEAIPSDKRVVLVTAHRRENFGTPIRAICAALKEMARRWNDIHIVYAVHPNPNVKGPVTEMLRGVRNISLLEPLSYLPFVHLMRQSAIVLTDSGGIQEEAPGLGKPVLVLRDVTERQEAVEAGTVRLVGTETDRIVAAAATLLESPAEYERMATAVNPYGDGKAAGRIVDAILTEETKRK